MKINYILRKNYYPSKLSYESVLKFVVQTMDIDDPHFPFCVSLLDYSMRTGKLTERQRDRITPFLVKYMEQIEEERKQAEEALFGHLPPVPHPQKSSNVIRLVKGGDE